MVSASVTPVASLAGGALVGIASVLLMALLGRIAGISGIAVRVLPPYLESGGAGRLAFVLGLVAAPAAWRLAVGPLPAMTVDASAPVLLAGGLLVGFGSVWGAGCTSGHGVCGLARLSRRSMVAVATFLTTAVLTVLVARSVGAL
jgi:uncharacterized membrane protein YedE/YeeE